eukprot:2142568-Prymnesium_polylepis.1
MTPPACQAEQAQEVRRRRAERQHARAERQQQQALTEAHLRVHAKRAQREKMRVRHPAPTGALEPHAWPQPRPTRACGMPCAPQ